MLFRLRYLVYAMIIILFSSMVYAGTYMYMGLKPGISTKQDVDNTLGAPLREIIRDVRYDYPTEGHNLRRISATFYKDTHILQAVSLYFDDAYRKNQFKEWFNLKEPTEIRIDANGNLVEYYLPEGIALYFEGSSDNDSIKTISYFDSSVLKSEYARSVKSDEGKRPYLGVYITGYEGFGLKVLRVIEDSPAQNAGIQVGDIILEMDSFRFYVKQMNPYEFVDILSRMPVDKPVRFGIKRGNKKLLLYIQLGVIDEDKIAVQNMNYAAQDYSQENDDYFLGMSKIQVERDAPETDVQKNTEAVNKLRWLIEDIVKQIQDFNKE